MTPSLAEDMADSSAIGFPQYLLGEGEYYRASTEFMRVLFTAKALRDTATVAVAIQGIVRASEIGGGTEVAADWLWRNRADIPCGGLGEAIRTRLLRLLIQANRPGDTVRLTSGIDDSFHCYGDDGIRHISAGIAYMQSNTVDRARREFLLVPDDSAVRPVALDYLNLVDTADSVPRKNPSMALALSAIPGLGYAYSGSMQTGIATLLVNGLLFFASYEAFQADQDAFGVLSGLFGVSWYVGGAFGAMRTAERFNQQKWDLYISQFRFPDLDSP